MHGQAGSSAKAPSPGMHDSAGALRWCRGINRPREYLLEKMHPSATQSHHQRPVFVMWKIPTFKLFPRHDP